MLAFIGRKLGDEIDTPVEENLFYEFNEMEDLSYYKQVLHVPNDVVSKPSVFMYIIAIQFQLSTFIASS